MKTIKKIMVLLTMLFLSWAASAQTQSFGGRVRIGVTPEAPTIDSLLVIGSDKVVKHVRYTDLYNKIFGSVNANFQNLAFTNVDNNFTSSQTIVGNAASLSFLSTSDPTNFNFKIGTSYNTTNSFSIANVSNRVVLNSDYNASNIHLGNEFSRIAIARDNQSRSGLTERLTVFGNVKADNFIGNWNGETKAEVLSDVAYTNINNGFTESQTINNGYLAINHSHATENPHIRIIGTNSANRNSYLSLETAGGAWVVSNGLSTESGDSNFHIKRSASTSPRFSIHRDFSRFYFYKTNYDLGITLDADGTSYFTNSISATNFIGNGNNLTNVNALTLEGSSKSDFVLDSEFSTKLFKSHTGQDWNTYAYKNGIHRMTGSTNNPFGSSHSTVLNIGQVDGSTYGFQIAGASSSLISPKYRYFSTTQDADWKTFTLNEVSNNFSASQTFSAGITSEKAGTDTHLTIKRGGTEVGNLGASSLGLRINSIDGGVTLFNNNRNDVDFQVEYAAGTALKLLGSSGNAMFGGSITTNSIIQSSSFIKNGGTSNQFLKADGSVDANTYLREATASAEIYGNWDFFEEVSFDSGIKLTSLNATTSEINAYGVSSLVNKQWVLDQNYLTAHQSLTNYAQLNAGNYFHGVNTFNGETNFHSEVLISSDLDMDGFDINNVIDIRADGFVKTGGTSNQILMADGSVSNKITNNNQLTNGAGFITTEVDGSVTNELQTLSKNGNTITLSNGGGSVVTTALSYRVYSVLLYQSGVLPPSPTTLENTLGYTPTWSKSSTGKYVLTLTNETGNKIIPIIQDYKLSAEGGEIKVNPASNSVTITTHNSSGTLIDGGLNSDFFELRIYNTQL